MQTVKEHLTPETTLLQGICRKLLAKSEVTSLLQIQDSRDSGSRAVVKIEDFQILKEINANRAHFSILELQELNLTNYKIYYIQIYSSLSTSLTLHDAYFLNLLIIPSRISFSILIMTVNNY